MKSVLISALMASAVRASVPAMAADSAGLALAKKSNCMACHQLDKKLVGPSYQDVAKKYAGDKTAEAKLVEKVKKGGSGVWGPVPMAPNPQVSDADLKTLVTWVLAGAK